MAVLRLGLKSRGPYHSPTRVSRRNSLRRETRPDNMFFPGLAVVRRCPVEDAKATANQSSAQTGYAIIVPAR